MKKKKTNPIKHKEEIPQHPDNKIDQDFEGFPRGHAGEDVIKPKTKNQKKNAATSVKDGEKRVSKGINKKGLG